MKVQIPLDTNPEIAAALGRFVGHFAMVEQCLIGILGRLLGVNQPRAQIVYAKFISLTTKLGLMQELAEHFVADGTLKDELVSLLAKATKLNKRRNTYIHSAWAAGNNASSLARLNADRRAPEIVTAARIQQDVDEVAELSARFQDFQFRVSPNLVIHDVPPAWLLS